MSSSKAVNVPVNEKQKEKDVNNKLQLYGIYQGTYRIVNMRGAPTKFAHVHNWPRAGVADLRCSICQWQSSLQ